MAVSAYLATWAPATIYGNLVCAAYDLYRLELYRALGWQAPEDPSAEQASGLHLTEFLFRGPPVPHPYVHLRGSLDRPYLRRHRAMAFSARRRRSASPPKTHRRRTS